MPPPPHCAQLPWEDPPSVVPRVIDAPGPLRITYYLYRAANDENYHLENVNLANMPGVMTYLHHEVVCNGGCPTRKFKITRIQRFKITSQATQAAFTACRVDPGQCEHSMAPFSRLGQPNGTGHQFMRFIGFDRGKRAWTPLGLPSVGCAHAEINSSFYHHEYEGATYYSLPGRCSSMEFDKSTPECLESEPGGECAEWWDVGISGCTWHAEPLGEVSVDDLTGFEGGLHEFCSHGGREWVSEGAHIAGSASNSMCTKYSRQHPGDGTGLGRVFANHTWGPTCFWDGRSDVARNRQRVRRLQQIFEAKYPHIIPSDITPPACGF